MGLHEDGRWTVSYSEINSFQRCEHQHKLSYVDGLRKNTEDIGASATGIIVHEAIAAALKWYHSHNYVQDEAAILNVILNTTREWADAHRPVTQSVIELDEFVFQNDEWTDKSEEFDAAVDEAAAIAYRTVLHLDVPNNWRTVELNHVPLIEYRIEEPILPEVTFVGYVDWVATELSTGAVYIIDWKTRKTFQEDESAFMSGEDFNVQLSLYQYVLVKQGVNVLGNIIYQISSRLPEIPDMTKTGSVSRSKIKTDWETYRNFVVSMGLDPADYDEMRIQLEKTEFWRPVTHYRSKTEITNRWKEAQQWALSIHNSRTSDNYYDKKNENVMCRFCPFAQICLAEDKGYDVDFVIEQRYNKRMEQVQEEPEKD